MACTRPRAASASKYCNQVRLGVSAMIFRTASPNIRRTSRIAAFTASVTTSAASRARATSRRVFACRMRRTRSRANRFDTAKYSAYKNLEFAESCSGARR